MFRTVKAKNKQEDILHLPVTVTVFKGTEYFMLPIVRRLGWVLSFLDLYVCQVSHLYQT